METACLSKTLALTYKTTQHQNPGQHQHHINLFENLKSHEVSGVIFSVPQ
jgi:hypothetical protein